ncbi:multicopper oxidase like protein [Lasiosphaeria miniovina]|uniref:Multicopper oxidase like protein n=1 Tax=Lasiosphaeria miniovina TaxID=1954250 RepID=A0AA40B6N8_9PEZI|nr:multicopper oxidase like protein [Lasiosphaeria miniovina]KAK0728667.1 multicopper oxidase like protein [Lasiosphaeria miniovina]
MLASGVLSAGFLSLATLVRAGTVTYNWNATWVWASPDGFARPVIGINGQWPCPLLNATLNDTVIVNFSNNLVNETSGLHFHGLNQLGTEDMDGPTGVTQCPVPPGSTIQYRFTVPNAGSYWYHSHDLGQYPDGLRGPLVVHDPNDPYIGQYDEEIILGVSDCIELGRQMLTPTNTHFAPPFPDALLINDGKGADINFVKGKTYRIRMICYSALSSAFIHFEKHVMNVIMTDASYIQEQEADMLRIAPAQRYDFLLTAGDNDSGNYPFLISLDTNRDYTNASLGVSFPHNYTGYLVMDNSKRLDNTLTVSKWEPYDDSKFKGKDGAGPLSPRNELVELDFKFCFDKNGDPRSCLNGLTYLTQPVPTLYTATTTGENNTNPLIYGQVNPAIVNYGDVVQIVLNNYDEALHPFHLHGHQFQVLDRPLSGAGKWSGQDINYSSEPLSRDTVTVYANSYVVIRFKATNPGVWLFHCHIEWHVEMGLTATIIEAPDHLRGFTFPDEFLNICKLQNIPYEGNAAGNTDNYTDTSGFVTLAPKQYNG